MFKIAVLDDEKEVTDNIKAYIDRYEKESGESFCVEVFGDGLAFLDKFRANEYDIIFLDIEMPYMNGMKTAQRIREKDEETTIVFITNMAQYAIEGYTVQAYSFVLKPVRYLDFSTLLARIIRKLDGNTENQMLTISSAGAKENIAVKDIIYVDISIHKAVYHLSNREIETWETMTSIEKKLEKYDFCRCNACYLVNLRYVKSLKGFTLQLLNGVELSVSQSKKKPFMQALTAYLGK